MKHFGWTFILYFLGFLIIQARAIPSWKSCSAHSDCQATGEYCRKTARICNHCALITIDSYGLTDSIDSSKPAWCNDTITSKDVTITSSSVLTFVKQSGFENDDLCPSFDACTIDCRKEYSVEKTVTQITLTSTFADTTDCVCDKLVFAEEEKEEATAETVGLHWKDNSTGTNFGTNANSILLEQYSTSALNIIVYNTPSYDVDCYWAYSIGTISSPPPPPPPPPSSPATTLTGLLGLISASVVAFVLV